jgi:ATP-binding cassette, subfamily B, bacterial
VSGGFGVSTVTTQSSAPLVGRASLNGLSSPAGSSQRFRQTVLSQLYRERWRLLLALASTLGATLAELASPWPLKIIFDYILLDRPLLPTVPIVAQLFGEQKVTALLLMAALMGLLAAISSGLTYAQVYLASRVGYQFVYRLRTELFSHLHRLSLAFHYRTRRGDLLSNVASDTATLKEVLTNTTLELISEGLAFVGMFVIMFALDWQLSLVILLSFPILLAIFWHLQRRLKESARRQRKNEGRLMSQLSEVLTAMLVVQAFGREGYEARRFEEESSDNLEEGIRLARLDAAVSRAVAMIGNLGLAVVVVFGVLKALQGQITPGDVLVFTSYVKNIYKPIGKVTRLTVKLTKAAVSAQRIAEILNIEPDIQDPPNALVATRLKGQVVFENVSFSYDEGRTTLEDVSFRLQPGKRLALVGASGAGKSTIATLILRLYDPQRGTIRVDGVDIRRYQRHSLRQHIGVVLQETLLFGATVRENVASGSP